MIVSVVGGVILVVAISAYFFMLLHAMKKKQQTLENELSQVSRDLAALCKASTGAGNRVIGAEQKLRRLIERQDQLELSSGNQKTYSQAIRMAQQGISAKELALNCGITQGEAELLSMLHSMPKAS